MRKIVSVSIDLQTAFSSWETCDERPSLLIPPDTFVDTMSKAVSDALGGLCGVFLGEKSKTISFYWQQKVHTFNNHNQLAIFLNELRVKASKEHKKALLQELRRLEKKIKENYHDFPTGCLSTVRVQCSFLNVDVDKNRR